MNKRAEVTLKIARRYGVKVPEKQISYFLLMEKESFSEQFKLGFPEEVETTEHVTLCLNCEMYLHSLARAHPFGVK